MGFLDVIKGAILEEDSAKAQEAVQQSKPLQALPGQAAPAVANGQDNEFAPILRQVIKGRQTAYTALLTASDRLASVIPDPGMRLRAAFEMVRGDGRTLAQVLSAIEVHTADLSSQKLSFEQALKQQKTEMLGALQSELDTIASANQSAQAAIQQLEAQVQALKDQTNQRNQRVAELQSKLRTEAEAYESKTRRFNTALATVSSDLTSQRTFIASTLQAAEQISQLPEKS